MTATLFDIIPYPDGPPACLPAGLDSAHLIDITQVKDAFRVFYDPHTDTTHDGAEYARQMQALIEAGK